MAHGDCNKMRVEQRVRYSDLAERGTLLVGDHRSRLYRMDGRAYRATFKSLGGFIGGWEVEEIAQNPS
jgi:hypothetical protein